MSKARSWDASKFAELCERVAGGRSVRDVCSDKDMPSRRVLNLWLIGEGLPEGLLDVVRDQYARAMEDRADAQFDELFMIVDGAEEAAHAEADEAARLANPMEASKIRRRVYMDEINARRLRIDVRKWALARMAPKKYGDRVVNAHEGVDGGPLQIVVSTGIDAPPNSRRGEAS